MFYDLLCRQIKKALKKKRVISFSAPLLSVLLVYTKAFDLSRVFFKKISCFLHRRKFILYITPAKIFEIFCMRYYWAAGRDVYKAIP